MDYGRRNLVALDEKETIDMAKKSMADRSFARAKKQFQSFFRNTPLVILGTGTSCTIDRRFGMCSLMDALSAGIRSFSLNKVAMRQWKAVEKALGKGIDVEHSLDLASASQLREQILRVTGDFVAKLDQEYAYKICCRELDWPAMSIIKKIVAGLSVSDHHALNVITTNYDLLFEYSCAAQGILCLDGFCGTVVRKDNWPAVIRTASHQVGIVSNKKGKAKQEFVPHVRLYKVHGSLNRFFINDEVVENDMWIGNAPENMERVIVTPGSAKYEKIQKYRKELQSEADKSVEFANGFLFLGYGMNDTHIERYIVQKISKEHKPTLFITRDSNERIEKLAKQNDSVWIVCGLEDPNAGTRIFNNQLGGWLKLPGRLLWDFSQFAKQMM